MKFKPIDGKRERENVTRHLDILLECMTLRFEHVYNIVERVSQNHYALQIYCKKYESLLQL